MEVKPQALDRSPPIWLMVVAGADGLVNGLNVCERAA